MLHRNSWIFFAMQQLYSSEFKVLPKKLICSQHAHYTSGWRHQQHQPEVTHIHGANGHQLCNWNFYPFIPAVCLPLIDSPNELSSMIDFHISGMPTLTKHWLLEKLCHACGVVWAVKYRAGSSLAWALSSLTCNVHANRHTFRSVHGDEM